MDRWWDDHDAAARVTGCWGDGDDGGVVVGTAALVLHAAGSQALGRAARDYLVNKHSLAPALVAIEDDPLIGAVCKAFDDVSGQPGYGAARVSQLKQDADAGAITMFNSLVASKVPVPVALIRAGLSYGLPPSDASVISKRMTGHDLVASHAADRALMIWAGLVAGAEMTVISKLERDEFTVDGLLRSVNRDDKGRFASQDKSKEAKEQRAKERRERFMSSSARRKMQARAKGGGIGEVARGEAPVAQMRDKPMEVQAEIRPEEAQRQERIARKKRIMRRASIAGRANAAQRARIEADAKDRIVRDIKALDKMHGAQLADMGRLKAEAAATQAAIEAQKRKPKAAPAQSGGKAATLPKMKMFDTGDPASTMKRAYLELPDGRKLALRVPMMMMPEDGERSGPGLRNPDTVSVVAMYAGLGNDKNGRDIARQALAHRNEPGPKAILQEVEDVHRYLNLLEASNGDIGRVFQIGEDATKKGADTVLMTHYAHGAGGETLRDIELAKQMMLESDLPDHIAMAQREKNIEMEESTYPGQPIVWNDEQSIEVLVESVLGSVGQTMSGILHERARMEDDSYVVGFGDSRYKTYGDFFQAISSTDAVDAFGDPDSPPVADAQAQMIRLVRAAQIYSLIEPADGTKKARSRMGFRFPKMVDQIGYDDYLVDEGIDLDDVAETIDDQLRDAKDRGRHPHETVYVHGLMYKPLLKEERMANPVIKLVTPSMMTTKEFDRNGMLGADLPLRFGAPPVPLIPASIEHPPPRTKVVPEDVGVLDSIGTHWRKWIEMDQGAFMLDNIKEITDRSREKITGHNAAEERKTAGQGLPPWF